MRLIEVKNENSHYAGSGSGERVRQHLLSVCYVLVVTVSGALI